MKTTCSEIGDRVKRQTVTVLAYWHGIIIMTLKSETVCLSNSDGKSRCQNLIYCHLMSCVFIFLLLLFWEVIHKTPSSCNYLEHVLDSLCTRTLKETPKEESATFSSSVPKSCCKVAQQCNLKLAAYIYWAPINTTFCWLFESVIGHYMVCSFSISFWAISGQRSGQCYNTHKAIYCQSNAHV